MPSCRVDEGGCQLLDDFAIRVQVFLGAMVIGALVIKRQLEHPRRPFTVWYLDVSKQCICAAVVHAVNLQFSYVARSWYDDRGEPMSHLVVPGSRRDNVCVWYLASVLWDTSCGLLLLYVWLKVLTAFLIKGLHVPLPRDYGAPPFLFNQLGRWAQQTIVFLLAALAMKLCQLWAFLCVPWFVDAGQWLLSLTIDDQGQDARMQIIFVMLIIPLVMNCIQFIVIDSMIKLMRRLAWPLSSKERIGGSTSCLTHVIVQNDDDHDAATILAPDERCPLLPRVPPASSSM
ncbi:vacuolar membrane protein-domain-containing protein [Gongronella butleri]|nr:vacuolar membrane protein-domain-containing protein [Gongronella butleri]